MLCWHFQVFYKIESHILPFKKNKLSLRWVELYSRTKKIQVTLYWRVEPLKHVPKQVRVIAERRNEINIAGARRALRARFTNVDQAWTKFKFHLDLGLAVIFVAPTQFRSNHEFNPEPPWTSDQTLIVGSTRVKQRPTHRDPCRLCPDWWQFRINCICVGILHPVSGYPSLNNYFNSLLGLL